MTSIQIIELAIAYAPSINDMVDTACFVMKVSLIVRYTIIKPTRR